MSPKKRRDPNERTLWNIRQVPSASTIINLALAAGSKSAMRQRKNTNASTYGSKIKVQEDSRLNSISSSLDKSFAAIIEDFPSLDRLDPFYISLIRCYMDYGMLKKSLGAVSWSRSTIQRFTKDFVHRIRRSIEPADIRRHAKAFQGRAFSAVKQISDNLDILESSRRILKEFPVLKEYYTVVLFGFPNSGKSTLLAHLTPAKPKIDSYAFTTKSINIGYLKTPRTTIQFLDTPGVLGRTKKNNIEIQADIAIKVADCILIVIDPSEEYSLQKQFKLITVAKKICSNVRVYVSKSDIYPVEASDIINTVKKKKNLKIVSELDMLSSELEDLAITYSKHQDNR